MCLLSLQISKKLRALALFERHNWLVFTDVGWNNIKTNAFLIILIWKNGIVDTTVSIREIPDLGSQITENNFELKSVLKSKH